jgi:hypothetical protein
MAQFREEPHRALDVISIPLPLRREFYERVDTITASRCTRSSHDFWAWLITEIPALKGKQCRMNLNNILRPVIEITGNEHVPKVGRTYEQVIVMTPEQENMYWEHLQSYTEHPSRLREFELWSWIASTWEEVSEGNWTVVGAGTGERIYLCKRSSHKDDE